MALEIWAGLIIYYPEQTPGGPEGGQGDVSAYNPLRADRLGVLPQKKSLGVTRSAPTDQIKGGQIHGIGCNFITKCPPLLGIDGDQYGRYVHLWLRHSSYQSSRSKFMAQDNNGARDDGSGAKLPAHDWCFLLFRCALSLIQHRLSQFSETTVAVCVSLT
jgi:hypothetical protein